MFGYKALSKDTFDSDRYTVIPTKQCQTGFVQFKDSGYEDHLDKVLVYVESNSSSDEPENTDATVANVDMSGIHRGEKRKVDFSKKKRRKKKV